MAFTESELGISQTEIDQIKDGLVNDGQADAFPQALAEAEQIVDDHCALWQVPDATRRRYWRTLALFNLRTRLHSVPESLTADHTKAMEALEKIRDGKSTYEEADSIPERFTGRWGSSDPFTT